MLSLEKCNDILNKKGIKYTQKKVKAIREFLYQMAEIISELKSSKDDNLTR